MTSPADITTDGPAAPPHRQHYGLTFAVLALGAGTYSVLQSLVAPALPEIQRDLHTSTTAVAWILTAYLLSASILTPIMGRLGDMFGKERWLVYSLGILAAGTLLAALATNITVMIVARIIQGAGGAIFPLAFGIIRDEFPRERVASGIALISAILGIGGGLGIVLAGPIVSALSYHWLFWIPFVLVVIATVMTVFFVPESPIKSPGSVNWLGAALLSGWLVCLLLAISQGSSWGWGDARIVGLFAGAVVAVRLVDLQRAAREGAARRHDDDARPRRLDRQRRGLPRRRRDVQLVHPDPAVHARCRVAAGLRLPRLGHAGRACSCCPRR